MILSLKFIIFKTYVFWKIFLSWYTYTKKLYFPYINFVFIFIVFALGWFEISWTGLNKLPRFYDWDCNEPTQPEWRQSTQSCRESDDTRATRLGPNGCDRSSYFLFKFFVLLITEKLVYIPGCITVHWNQKYKTKETILWICGMFKVFQKTLNDHRKTRSTPINLWLLLVSINISICRRYFVFPCSSHSVQLIMFEM